MDVEVTILRWGLLFLAIIVVVAIIVWIAYLVASIFRNRGK